MNCPRTINDAHIVVRGDRTVGIDDATWNIEFMNFEATHERDAADLRRNISDLFEFITGEKPEVMFDFELDEMNKQLEPQEQQ
jgi:hypothetical protein